MSRGEGTENQDDTLTPFQSSCRELVEVLMLDKGKEFGFEYICGEGEGYLRGSFTHKGDNFEVYIYIDEAGYFKGRKWRIFEREDFDSQQELEMKFIGELKGELS